MKTVLITGGYGFLGRNAAIKFSDLGYRVIGIGNGLYRGDESARAGYHVWINSQVTQSNLSAIKENIDIVIHCAGSSSVTKSIQYPNQDYIKTVLSTQEVLEYIKNHQPKALLIYPSSAAVYGMKFDKPINEVDFTNPASPYGHSKLIAEDTIRSYSEKYNIKSVIIRFFSIYGPGLSKQLLWEACEKFSIDNEFSYFWGDGSETRDWIYIDDAIRLIICSTKIKKKFILINGGVGRRVSIKHTLNLLCRLFGNNDKVRFTGQVREGDPKYFLADIKSALDLNWRPLVPLENGLNKYYDWYLDYKKNIKI